jgi:hypothetical protein
MDTSETEIGVQLRNFVRIISAVLVRRGNVLYTDPRPVDCRPTIAVFGIPNYSHISD